MLVTQLKLSVSQFLVRGSQSLEAFLQAADAQINEAKKADSALLLFPELFILDMLKPGRPAEEAQQLAQMARDLAPRLHAHFKERANGTGMAIAAGTWPRWTGSAVRNAATFFFADGRELQQDKLQLTPDEKKWGWERGDVLRVFDAPWGRTCTLICLDCEIPEHSNLLVPQKPELILLPSMTSDVHGFHRVRWSAQARAVEHLACVAHSAIVGSRGTSDYYGQAALLTAAQPSLPGLVAEGKTNEAALVHGVFDFSRLRATRKIDCVYPAREQWERVQRPRVEAT